MPSFKFMCTRRCTLADEYCPSLQLCFHQNIFTTSIEPSGRAEENISLVFFSPQGKYLASVNSGTNGNVLLEEINSDMQMMKKNPLKYQKILLQEKYIIQNMFYSDV